MSCPTDRSGGQVANGPKLCFGPTAVKRRVASRRCPIRLGPVPSSGGPYGSDVVRGWGLQPTVGAHSSAAR